MRIEPIFVDQIFNPEMARRAHPLRVIKAAHGQVAIRAFQILKAKRSSARAAKRTARNRGGLIPVRPALPNKLRLRHIEETRRKAAGCALAHTTMAQIGLFIRKAHTITHIAALAAAGLFYASLFYTGLFYFGLFGKARAAYLPFSVTGIPASPVGPKMKVFAPRAVSIACSIRSWAS